VYELFEPYKVLLGISAADIVTKNTKKFVFEDSFCRIFAQNIDDTEKIDLFVIFTYYFSIRYSFFVKNRRWLFCAFWLTIMNTSLKIQLPIKREYSIML